MIHPIALLPKSILRTRSFASASARWLLAVLFGWLGIVSSCTELQAGCSSWNGSHAQAIESKPSAPGQLVLAMYVRYERGSLSFTLERPVRPCEGPSCSSKSTFEPTFLPLATYRPIATQVANSPIRRSSTSSSGDSFARPSSERAPRGAIEVCEPPPKFAS